MRFDEPESCTGSSWKDTTGGVNKTLRIRPTGGTERFVGPGLPGKRISHVGQELSVLADMKILFRWSVENDGPGKAESKLLGESRMQTEVENDITQVWRDYRANPTIELRNRLMEKYMPLVRYNAERIWNRLPDGVELDDLTSSGIFGLLDAIEAFDLERGVKFETYCVPRIRGAMLDELRTMDWVPRLVRSKASKVEVARKQLEAEYGRPPRPEEMAVKMGISIEEYLKMAAEATAVSQVSLNKKWYETDSYKDVREIDILEDKKAEDPTHKIQNRDLMRLVTRGLNRNERLIIILYYYEDMTMKEIGATLDLSESRVSQMHSSIVSRLQAQLCERRPEFGL